MLDVRSIYVKFFTIAPGLPYLTRQAQIFHSLILLHNVVEFFLYS